MNRLAAYCYGISTVATACIIQNSATPEFWQDRLYTSIVLASVIPINVGMGWLIEHRPIDGRTLFYEVACIFGIAIGLIGIGMFLLSVSPHMGMGFFVGSFVTFCFIGLIRHYPPSNPKEEDPDGSKH